MILGLWASARSATIIVPPTGWAVDASCKSSFETKVSSQSVRKACNLICGTLFIDASDPSYLLWDLSNADEAYCDLRETEVCSRTSNPNIYECNCEFFGSSLKCRALCECTVEQCGAAAWQSPTRCLGCPIGVEQQNRTTFLSVRLKNNSQFSFCVDYIRTTPCDTQQTCASDATFDNHFFIVFGSVFGLLIIIPLVVTIRRSTKRKGRVSDSSFARYATAQASGSSPGPPVSHADRAVQPRGSRSPPTSTTATTTYNWHHPPPSGAPPRPQRGSYSRTRPVASTTSTSASRTNRLGGAGRGSRMTGVPEDQTLTTPRLRELEEQGRREGGVQSGLRSDIRVLEDDAYTLSTHRGRRLPGWGQGSVASSVSVSPRGV